MQNRNPNRLAYRPAALFEGKDWYVGYYAYHPIEGVLKRVRHKLNHIPSLRERRKVGADLVRQINASLHRGWNPFVIEEEAKQYERVLTIMSKFMAVKKLEQAEMGHTSYKTYQKIFTAWLIAQGRDDISIDEFDSSLAARFMEYIHDKRSSNAHTYNHYLMYMKTFWNWMNEFEYADVNPFKKLRAKKRTTKSRTIIPGPVRADIREYLEENDPHFLVVCFLVFHCLIRPVEICRLRVRDVNLRSQVIVIPASSTKNGKQRISTIPDVLMPSIVDLVNGGVLRDYLISDYMRPGQNKMTTRIMRYRWSLVKQALDLPKSYMFYSLRDSGIVQKLQDNISPEEVMKQAGHWSLEITTMYVNHFSPTGSEQVKTRASEF